MGKFARVFAIIVCCIIATYGVLFVVGASRDLFVLVQGSHAKRYWSEDVRGNVGFILIGLVLAIASARWLTHLLRPRRSPGG